MSLNENIAKYRSIAGETQGQLADVLGVSNRTVSKWECGEGEPDVSAMIKIADHYGVTLDELCGHKTDKTGMYDGLSVNDAIVKMYGDMINCVRQLQKYLERRDDETYEEIKASDALVPPAMLTPMPAAPGKEHGESPAATGVFMSGIWSEVINTPENNYAMTVLRNEQNFRWMTDHAEELAELFSHLADPGTLKLLHLLLTESFQRGFTADYIAKAAGVSAEKAAAFLEYAGVYADNVELLDGTARVYDHFDAVSAGEWTAMVCLAYEVIQPHCSYDGYYKAMYRPVLADTGASGFGKEE